MNRYEQDVVISVNINSIGFEFDDDWEFQGASFRKKKDIYYLTIHRLNRIESNLMHL